MRLHKIIFKGSSYNMILKEGFVVCTWHNASLQYTDTKLLEGYKSVREYMTRATVLILTLCVHKTICQPTKKLARI